MQPPAFPPPFGLPIPGGAIRFNIGTSEAAAQVSGAAALYRATRASASADETRAAVLLNVLSPYVGTYTGGTGHQQHSYTGRNTFGVGYVRDDLLAEFAVRGLPNAPDIKALHSTVPLAQLGVDAVIPYTGLVSGRRYAVAVAWPRIFFDADEFVALANVDVEVRLNGAMIGRSASPANSYERLAFTMPEGATAVDIVVRLGDVPWWFPNLVGFGTVLVHVVAREFEPDYDTTTPAFEPTPVHASTGLVESLPPAAQGQCTGPAWDLTPVRTVPLDYAQAYGSMAVNLTPVLSSPANFAPPGYTRGLNLRTGANTGPGGRSMHFEISGSTSPEFPLGRVGAPMTIGGIAFRTWRPFAVSGSLAVTITMGSTAAGPVDQNSLLLLSSAVPGAIDVVSTTLPGVSADWVARGYDEFPIVVPFTTPGGNLHVWMTIGTTTVGSYVVDAIEDGATPNYGALIATPGVSSWFIESGKCPVIALLPAAPAPPLPDLQPLLRALGEPMVGSSLELQVMHAPANSGVFVTFALTWQPGASMVGNCMQHIASPFSSLFIPTGAAGFARMPVTFGLNANLIHGTMGIQALVIPPSSPSILTNALRLTIGGAL